MFYLARFFTLFSCPTWQYPRYFFLKLGLDIYSFFLFILLLLIIFMLSILFFYHFLKSFCFPENGTERTYPWNSGLLHLLFKFIINSYGLLPQSPMSYYNYRSIYFFRRVLQNCKRFSPTVQLKTIIQYDLPVLLKPSRWNMVSMSKYSIYKYFRV